MCKVSLFSLLPVEVQREIQLFSSLFSLVSSPVYLFSYPPLFCPFSSLSLLSCIFSSVFSQSFSLFRIIYDTGRILAAAVAISRAFHGTIAVAEEDVGKNIN
jgi:hypothetical protein